MNSSHDHKLRNAIFGASLLGAAMLPSMGAAQSAIDRIVNNPDYSTTYEAGNIVNSQRNEPVKGHLRDALKADRWQKVYGAEEARIAGYADPQDFVRQIQIGLADWGADLGPPDGVLGPKTEAAIREYQAANAMMVTGKPSAALYKSLQNRLPEIIPGGRPVE